MLVLTICQEHVPFDVRRNQMRLRLRKPLRRFHKAPKRPNGSKHWPECVLAWTWSWRTPHV